MILCHVWESQHLRWWWTWDWYSCMIIIKMWDYSNYKWKIEQKLREEPERWAWKLRERRWELPTWPRSRRRTSFSSTASAAELGAGTSSGASWRIPATKSAASSSPAAESTAPTLAPSNPSTNTASLSPTSSRSCRRIRRSSLLTALYSLSLSLSITSCMICLIEALESVLSGDSGRPQCRRAKRDSGESPVREEDRTRRVRRSHDAEIGIHDRWGSHGCKFLLTRSRFTILKFRFRRGKNDAVLDNCIHEMVVVKHSVYIKLLK